MDRREPGDLPELTDAAEAARRLADGGLVAIPTETVYGLAADATDPVAVARVYDVKGRPTDHPLIVHVADIETARRCCVLDSRAEALSMLWPGPLTMILPRTELVPAAVTGGLESVAVRIPDHPLTLEMLRHLGGPVAAPSANRFGRVSPTTADHVVADIGTLLDPVRDAVLDGGPCLVGIESTIVDLTVEPAQILRPGAVSGQLLDRLLLPVSGSPTAAASGPSRASGMLASHYAPARPVQLVERDERDTIGDDHTAVIDRSDDPVEAARHLYDDLRRADSQPASGATTITVVLPADDGGIGTAVRDRLRQAAAPRDHHRTSRDG